MKTEQEQRRGAFEKLIECMDSVGIDGISFEVFVQALVETTVISASTNGWTREKLLDVVGREYDADRCDADQGR